MHHYLFQLRVLAIFSCCCILHDWHPVCFKEELSWSNLDIKAHLLCFFSTKAIISFWTNCIVIFLVVSDSLIELQKILQVYFLYFFQMQDFFVADASENQVFLAVTHDQRTTHLYISDTSGIKYSMSMERVLYFSQNTSAAWLRYF